MWGWILKYFKPKIMNGIDCSHFQGHINFSEVLKNDPKIDFIYIKATQGVGYTDPALQYNSSEAKKAGLKIGYYHYASINTQDVESDAKAEARYFVSIIEQRSIPDLPLALDIEENKSNLSKEKVLLWIQTFFSELENIHRKDYILYSYTSFLNDNLPKIHNLGNIRLWIAAYVNKPEPVLPNGWRQYYMWQYSAKGHVKGIVGDVDINKTNPSNL
jgi:GH25 family lysozyme M1 (1,4-beta-N-acetylmuramidase)